MAIRFSRLTLATVVSLLFSALLASAANAVETEPSAERILSKLTSAMRERNFRGVFTYEHGGSLETMEVTHLVADGREHERYILLNGPEQSMVRGGRESDCQSLAGRLMRGDLLVSADDRALRFNEYYHLGVTGYDRVAGRQVAVVQVLPKDANRYGMSFGIDLESGVLLKVLVMSRKKVLERMQFVAFELDPELQPEERSALLQNSTGKSCQPRAADEELANTVEPAPSPLSPWRPHWVPQGFTLAGSRETVEDGVVDTYTDGLASFSIFTKLVPVGPETEDKRLPRGVAQRGATIVLMTLLPLEKAVVHVTLVGEVPENAALKVVQSLVAEPSTGSP